MENLKIQVLTLQYFCLTTGNFESKQQQIIAHKSINVLKISVIIMLSNEQKRKPFFLTKIDLFAFRKKNNFCFSFR